jgi:hypothetical protein
MSSSLLLSILQRQLRRKELTGCAEDDLQEIEEGWFPYKGYLSHTIRFDIKLRILTICDPRDPCHEPTAQSASAM